MVQKARIISEDEYHTVLGGLQYSARAIEEIREKLASLANKLYEINELLSRDDD